MTSHHERIREQFTKQAEPFATSPQIRDGEALRFIVEATQASSEDAILDVACGPGLLTCAFAKVVRRATGIDLTPAMIEKARELQADMDLGGVSWCVGDVARLPFAAGTFSIVVSRFAFHHMLDPKAVLSEMARVCQPKGRIAVADVAVSSDPRKADTFNRMERLRDPSHVRAMTLAEIEALFLDSGLLVSRVGRYRMNVGVKGLLERSFPAPGDDVKVRAMFEEWLADDGMGMDARRVGDDIRFDYPIAVLVAERPDERSA